MKLRNLLLAGLLLLGVYHGAQAAIEDWSTTANSNNATPPDGFPESQLPSTLNNSARELMAQVRRWAEQAVSGTWNADDGSADAYAITPEIAPSSLVSGQVFRFKAANTNTGASNLKVGSLSTITIAKISDTDLEAGDIVEDVTYTVVYDGTYMQLQPSTRFVADSNPSPITTEGDLVQGDSSGDPARLAVGSAGQIIHTDGTSVAWTTITPASITVSGIVELATQSELEAGTDAARVVTPVVQQHHPSAAKAWAIVEDDATLSDSYNVSSIDDNGTGNHTVNWAQVFSSANYAVAVAYTQDADVASTYLQNCSGKLMAADSIDVLCGNANAGTATDSDFSIVAYGDQ